MCATNKIPGKGFCNFYVHTDDPFGNWSDPIWVSQGGIDPSLHFDEITGKVYWTGNGTSWAKERGIYQSEIDLASGRLLSDVHFIWAGTGGSYPESPHLYQRGGFYYLSIAEGGTAECHMVTVARSSKPFGPFESCPANPVLTHRSLQNPITSTGHADFVVDHRGQWWVVFLSIRYANANFHTLGRETCLAPVEWSRDGWPVVNDNEKVALEMEVKHHLPLHPWPGIPFARDDFDRDQLEMSWVFLRNPDPEDWSLYVRPGHLRLRCSPVTLDEERSPSFLARRQQHMECQVRTLIDFDPGGENEEAGLALVMNIDHHAELLITQRGGHRVAVLRRRVGTLVGETCSAPLPEGPTEMVMRADRTHYRFGVALPGGNFLEVGTHELRYLSTEVAGGYVGLMIGLYAGAQGTASTNQAFFDWFEYKPI